MSPDAWSSPTLLPSLEAEFIPFASVPSPHKVDEADGSEILVVMQKLLAAAEHARYLACTSGCGSGLEVIC
jgi:hypothetical protein